MKCPCCGGTGTISADAEPPVYLPRIQRQIWNIVQQSPGIRSKKLADVLYPTHGPADKTVSVRVNVWLLNKKLMKIGQRISATRNGCYDGYRLYQD